jgi:ankyrin repeat protein
LKNGNAIVSNTSASECQFFDAIVDGRREEVRQLVAANPNLLLSHDYRRFGATPITSIAFRDAASLDLEMIQCLIDLGADLDRRSDWWAGPWSPLHCAICVGNNALAEFLLSRGATLDLHTAASLGMRMELARLLDADPSRVHERGGDGCLPLHFAGTVDCAKLLVERGADIHARCVDHYSTAVQYLSHVRPEVTRYLFSIGAEPDIFTAVMSGDVELSRRLMAQNPHVVYERIDQARFPPGEEHDVHNMLTYVVGHHATSVHAAARVNRPEMVDLLQAAGADLNSRGGYDDATPLHVAAWNDHLEVAERLVALGADIDLRSGAMHNNTPAGWAIVAGSHRVFALLMDHGAAVQPWFADDAQTAVDGGFRQYKPVPDENYARIRDRLQLRTNR